MMDLDTLARRHAECARETAATATPPTLPIPAAGARTIVSRVPKPVWAVLAAIMAVVVLGLPSLLREPEPEQTPITTPNTTITTPNTTPEGHESFVPTGRLSFGCAWCQTVVLDDGRILVLGGAPEIYDPATETFTVVEAEGAVGNARAAVRLHDGRVLTSDGNSQWLFDPATTTFQMVGELPAFVMGLLGDGRALLLGHPSGIAWNRTYLFDPESNEFEEGPPTLHPHGDGLSGAVVALLDGRVLLLGTTVSEVFDPVTDSFTEVGHHLNRSGFTATLLSDGRVLIVGGQEESEPFDLVRMAEIFDPSTGEFTPVGELDQGRFWHAAALLPDGTVLVVGGASGDLRSGLDQAEIFDPSSGEFAAVPSSMTRERVAPGAVALPDGRVLIVGHYPGNGGFGSDEGSSTAELFIPGPVGDGTVKADDNPTEVTLEVDFDLGQLPVGSSSPLSLEGRLVVPPGSLDGRSGVAVTAGLEVVGDPSAGTVSVTVGSPFNQDLSIDLSDLGGTGGGGETSLPEHCDEGCDLVIPITVSWTGSDSPPPGILNLWLEIAYQGGPPEAAGGLALTVGFEDG